MTLDYNAFVCDVDFSTSDSVKLYRTDEQLGLNENARIDFHFSLSHK